MKTPVKSDAIVNRRRRRFRQGYPGLRVAVTHENPGWHERLVLGVVEPSARNVAQCPDRDGLTGFLNGSLNVVKIEQKRERYPPPRHHILFG